MHNVGKPYKPARLVTLKNPMATHIRKADNYMVLVTTLKAVITCTIWRSVDTFAQRHFLLCSCCLSDTMMRRQAPEPPSFRIRPLDTMQHDLRESWGTTSLEELGHKNHDRTRDSQPDDTTLRLASILLCVSITSSGRVIDIRFFRMSRVLGVFLHVNNISWRVIFSGVFGRRGLRREKFIRELRTLAGRVRIIGLVMCGGDCSNYMLCLAQGQRINGGVGKHNIVRRLVKNKSLHI